MAHGDRHFGGYSVFVERAGGRARASRVGHRGPSGHVGREFSRNAIGTGGRFGPDTAVGFERLIRAVQLVVLPFDEPQARLAAQAFLRYGKGQNHPAQLNMGDCAAYALATTLNEPLLFVGDDFTHTDVARC